VRVSLLMKSTRVPGGTVSTAGLTPFEVIVMVLLARDGSGVTVGAEGAPPPQLGRKSAANPNSIILVV
jgi:hypothetical protein